MFNTEKHNVSLNTFIPFSTSKTITTKVAKSPISKKKIQSLGKSEVTSWLDAFSQLLLHVFAKNCDKLT